MAENNLYYFLEIIKGCSACKKNIAQKKDKTDFISAVMRLVDADEELELKNLCELCNGKQGFVQEEVIKWTDSFFETVSCFRKLERGTG